MENSRWNAAATVVVVGAKDGVITNRPEDKQRFPTLSEAARVFPDLTPDVGGYRFTAARYDDDTDEMVFWTRALAEAQEAGS
ncbi:ADP-ribosylglycohydrolase family protein [Truepera radiovictrix]|uniref:Uncharacterized protein n=1 Tax=Truepera radiovictrix (strain DSM 17093 / CIP 108686 / LMG 22925 / RQ-24) TaxID=649638 RepID=D7CSN7_TRURR|nr:ADP-ribosylglycohydrolase family protein [Truepera radiovictrix]ADI15457.1 hypothetical protein Trad_2348 [Truepera radiovictrix DSM 17093]WMT55992.1 ADP-ribosylglycohydrolase family protein [Truepera radiovictrix]